MKTVYAGLFVGLTLFVFVRCSGPRVIAFTGNNPDFSSYYTYRIKHPGTPKQGDEAAQKFFKKVETALKDEMNMRGYEHTEVSDIVVTYNLILDNKVDYRIDRSGRYRYAYPYYNPYSNYPYWFERNEFTQGMLLVELREELSNKLIWQASLDMKYRRRSSNKKKADPVEDAFRIIFSEYPYIAGSNEIRISENQ